MHHADVWFAPYLYHKESNTTFIRERVFKTSLGLRFQDPVHEGVHAMGNRADAVNSWQIIHERTEKEMIEDRGRNLAILEAIKDPSPRMRFYLGKEYFDIGKYKESAEILQEALKLDLQPGDRILGIQYCVHSLIQTSQWDLAIKYAHIGLNLDPTRAEFYCFLGDIYCNMQRLHDAIPFYRAASSCVNKGNGLTHEFTHDACYWDYPKTSLAKIYYHLGDYRKCLDEALDVNTPEAAKMREACEKYLSDMDFSQSRDCMDIVITCPMPVAYPWDEEVYKHKGMGGSETAAIEMARLLKNKTGRQVKIFQDRESTFVAESGVEYIPLKFMHRYFKKWKPALHVAWRHNFKLTNAYTAVWCHDLTFPQLRDHKNFDVLLALSDFHKDYLIASTGVPKEKITITRNGINPDRFKDLKIEKDGLRVVFPSSPDRGLEVAMLIMDRVRAKGTPAELHCYYGLENLYKFGQAEKADMLKKMISERPWVKYVGNVQQDVLVKEMSKAKVWLYPATFIESSCITALECLLTKTYPIVRKVGALPNTLKRATDREMASVVDWDIQDKDLDQWADLVDDALILDYYQDMEFDPEEISWGSVAEEWKKMFNL